MMLKVNFIVKKKYENMRLDKLLKRRYPEFTRFEIKRAILDGIIRVNTQETKPSYFLKVGDQVEGIIKKLSDIYLKPNKDIPIKILYQDSEILAINKDSGYPVYPSRHHQHNTIANGLLVKFPYLKKEFYGSIRLGILHRLDKETSGVLLVAKNRESFYNISKLFEKRLISKTYIALVFGNLEQKEGCVNLTLARSFSDPRKRLVISAPDASKNKNLKIKQAITCYKVIQSFKNFDLVEMYPKTGRMHQLRAHFFYLNHPILGDNLYWNEEFNRLPVVPRLMLHASKVEFVYKNRNYKIEASLPDEFKQILNNTL